MSIDYTKKVKHPWYNKKAKLNKKKQKLIKSTYCPIFGQRIIIE